MRNFGAYPTNETQRRPEEQENLRQVQREIRSQAMLARLVMVLICGMACLSLLWRLFGWRFR